MLAKVRMPIGRIGIFLERFLPIDSVVYFCREFHDATKVSLSIQLDVGITCGNNSDTCTLYYGCWGPGRVHVYMYSFMYMPFTNKAWQESWKIKMKPDIGNESTLRFTCVYISTLVKKKLNEPRECLFKGLRSKVLLKSKTSVDLVGINNSACKNGYTFRNMDFYRVLFRQTGGETDRK